MKCCRCELARLKDRGPRKGHDKSTSAVWVRFCRNQTAISRINIPRELPGHVHAHIHQNKCPISHANLAKLLPERQPENNQTTNTGNLWLGARSFINQVELAVSAFYYCRIYTSHLQPLFPATPRRFTDQLSNKGD